MKDVLAELAKRMGKYSMNVLAPESKTGISTTQDGSPSDEITYEPLLQRLQSFIKPNYHAVGDTSAIALAFVPRVNFPEGVDYESGTSFGMLGFGTGVILGTSVHGGERRNVLISGDGAHQMTANEIGAFGRYGLKPIMIVINNGGYFAERMTNRYPDEKYNDIAPWNYADLPAALGCDDWFTAKTTNLRETFFPYGSGKPSEAGFLPGIAVYDELEIIAELSADDPWLFVPARIDPSRQWGIEHEAVGGFIGEVSAIQGQFPGAAW